MALYQGLKLREYCRWINGWQRGYGHRFELMLTNAGKRRIKCKNCGIGPLIAGRKPFPYSSKQLQFRFMRMIQGLGYCKDMQVKQVMTA